MPRLRATDATLPLPLPPRAGASASTTTALSDQARAARPLRSAPLLRLFVAATLAVSLVACGGGGGDAPAPTPTPTPTPPPPPTNQPPVASFTHAATGQAGAALAFDATASTDPDNDPLTFSWEFGDGTRGGGATLAHVFTAGGSYTVRLTVADSRGASTSTQRTVTVSAGPAAGAPATLQTVVSDGSAPLAGVTVSIVGASTVGASTGADGKADVAVPTGVPAQLKFSKAGFADQFKQVEIATGGTGASIEVRMLPREAALTLPDAAAGGTLTGRDGARIVLPPNALVNASGQPVTGAVQISMTPVNVATNPRAFPGSFFGVQASGARGLIASHGVVEIVLTQSGQPLQLAPGRKATIEIPIYASRNFNGTDIAAGATIPLWSLDERTAQWVQEGTGIVVASTASPSELALRAEVGHFSWWNCDQWLGRVPDDSYNPNGRCCIRDTPTGPCKENSGDICNASGSPSQNGPSPSPFFSERVRPLAVDPVTRRIPLTVATAQFPALTGGALPMPANVDIDVVASARNGTYRGSRVFRGGAGVRETVSIDLLPVAGGGNDDVITLPWTQVVSMTATGELDRYRLTLPAGPGFELRVAPSSSSLSGSVRVIRPGGAVAATATFSTTATAYIAEPTVATAGEYQIEITAGSGTPGAYRLEAVSFGACSSTETLTLPVTQNISLGPNQSRCYDIALAADEVFRSDVVTRTNGISGSVSFGTAGGVQTLAAREYPASVGSSSNFLAGVSAAGTYRLRATNRTLATGTLTLALAKPAAQVLAVPSSVAVSDLVTSTPRLFVVKPGTDGLFHVALANTGGQVGVQFEPSRSSFLVASQPAALAGRVSAPLLPVVVLFRNSGSGTVTVSAGAPTLLARDTDIIATLAAGTIGVYAFDGTAGETIAYGRAAADFSSLAAMGVNASDGTPLGNASTALVLPASGLYTVQLTAPAANPAQTTFRINNVPAPVALTLTPPVTNRAIDLPLGQVLRYTFDVTRGELAGLRLATSGPLNVSAAISGVAALATPTSGSGPFNVSTPPSFVYTTGPATLTVRSTSTLLERARGSATVGVVRPEPASTPLDTAVTGSVAVGEWTSYRFTVAATGRYLLRLGTSASGSFGVQATAWAATTPFGAGYVGEFSSSRESSSVPIEGLGELAAGDVTVTVRNLTLDPGAVPFTLALVSLDAPVPLSAGAAPTAGTIDIDGERDYFSFTGTGGQAYTVRVTPSFSGTVRVRKLNPTGDFTNRASEILNLAGTPAAVTAGATATLSFTIPADATFGNGTYIVEVVAGAGSTGGYTVQLTSP